MQMRPFEYVPATITGCLPNAYFAVRYEDNTNKDYLWKRVRYNGMTTHWTPDRTLFYGVCRNKAGTSGIGTEEFDLFFFMSPNTQPQVLVNAGFKYAMASPLHVSKETETRRNKHIKLFSDSGGFQLISGASDWIDMDTLIDFYNRTIDYGIGLDIPTPSFLQEKYLMRMCEVMIKNNTYLRNRAVSDVEIYDVSHGTTVPLRQQMLKRIVQQKIKDKIEGGGLAIGGIAQNIAEGGLLSTMITGTVNLMYALLTTKGMYERYHVLGTTNSFFQFLYHIVLMKGGAKHITADSTSYILPSANNQIITGRQDAIHRLVTTRIPKTNHSYTMGCCCPICSHAKYLKEFYFNCRLNSLHSLYVISNQRDRIEECAKDYIEGKVKLDEALRGIINAVGGIASSTLKAHMLCIHFVESCCEIGFKKSFEKYQPQFKFYLRGEIKKGSLFKDIKPAAAIKKEKRLDFILKRYEDFHSNRRKN
jgi:hypothetical protein